MSHLRLRPSIAVVLSAALLSLLPGNPVQSRPHPKERPTIRLAAAGKMEVAELWVRDAALVDEATVVLVGTKNNGEVVPPLMGEPNGAIVDLGKKATRKFTNGHKAGIWSVSVGRGRIATASDHSDPVLRVWDLKAGKTVTEVEIEKREEEGGPNYAAAWFHKSDRVAVAAGERVIVFDPAKPVERTELANPQMKAWLSHPIAVSPDDAWVACTVNLAQVAVWEVETRKGTAVSLVPEKADESEQWMSQGVAFGPKGTLIAWRTGSSGEVPEKMKEADVPADRRGVVQIDLPGGNVVPLGVGHTVDTLCCAFDPTGTWLATVGRSDPDKPRPDGIIVVGELRVYHLPSKELAYREQLGDCGPTWVSFTPSGKRLVCATGNGGVRWWDVHEKK